ncbi:hypothetical protein GM418_25120 [Maribellus comscasis]|uniref:Uncharacterized protein n=1 Tax=Maribellus comscasis TaxID=2681766 RepID=A0A6I6K065_9BACT|nr:hypothetical protein [Maribellus comscasis]QGY46818.1 hypothetical protein GM418_25120 [Maribellus comscasis]
MREKSKVNKEKPDFVAQIPEYSDEEILEILKKRNHYQPDAARLAINEALKRNLINTEDDLLQMEYRVKPLKKSFFPEIDDDTQKKKISRSISRGLFIAGIIPLIFGLIKINEGQQTEGGIVIVVGILWMALAAQTIREVKPGTLRLFLIFLVIAAVYIFRIFLKLKSFIFMDLFIVATIYGLTIYGLLYLMKLHATKKPKS